MRYRALPFIAVACGILAGSAFADGLVFQLPPDGTWARYALKMDGEMGFAPYPAQASDDEQSRKIRRDFANMPKQKLETTSALTISSVGEVTRNEQTCRWIELKMENKAEGLHPKLVLKMLIPEDRLQRGKDPLSHAVLTFFNPKEGDKKGVEPFIGEEGFNRIQYEIDRFRGIFPRPLDNAQSLKRETVDTPAGKFEDCEVLTGTSDYDGPLAALGRMVYKASYRIVVHPKAPFGVVSMQIEMEDREFSSGGIVSLKGKEVLTLVETGNKAVSDLPNKGK